MPLQLRSGAVEVRSLRLRDAPAWASLRVHDEAWLAPWEGTPAAAPATTWSERHSTSAFALLQRRARREERAGTGLTCAITVAGRLAGQVVVTGVVRGAFDNGHLGYWVASAVAGRGVAPTATALLADHCFDVLGLHRLQAAVRPENTASRRVMDKLGFQEEGRHRRYLFIDGAWRDHVSYALLREDVPGGVLVRYLATR